MFIKIFDKNRDKAINLNQKAITSFTETFGTSPDVDGPNSVRLVELEIEVEKVQYVAVGSSEELNEIVTQIVRQDPTSLLVQTALETVAQSLSPSIQHEAVEALTGTTTKLLMQVAQLAKALKQLNDRVSNLDGTKEPAKTEPEAQPVTETEEEPQQAA